MSLVNVTLVAAVAGPAPNAGVAASNNPSDQVVRARANLTAIDIASSSGSGVVYSIAASGRTARLCQMSPRTASAHQGT